MSSPHTGIETASASQASGAPDGASTAVAAAAEPATSLRARVYSLLEGDPSSDQTQVVDVLIAALILINVAALILETMPEVEASWGTALQRIEAFSLAVFTIEYLLRVWSCTEATDYSRPLIGRLRFAMTPLALFDLVAVAPFYLALLGAFPDGVGASRLFRMLRLVKLGRSSHSLRTFGRVLSDKRGELASALLIMAFLLVSSASLMFFVEHEAQPRVFSSIPASMWWAVATLTTVGYGDIYPVTSAGKILASLSAVLGIAMFALPAGILGAAFTEEVARRKGGKNCPHCGGKI